MNTSLDLPQWMTIKLAKIAAKRDIWQLEQNEITILAAELHVLPEYARRVLPEAFIAKVARRMPRELDDIERASIILAARDWANVADVYLESTTEEKITAKLDALALCLRAGGEP